MALTDELDYPARGPDALKTILIGGALLFAAVLINLIGSVLTIVLIGFLILPFAFIPQILTQGYLVRVLDSTLDGGVEPPVWEDWTDVFVDGLKLFLVVLVYSLPLVVLAVVFAVVFAGLSAGIGAAGDAGGAVAGVSAVLGLVFGLVTLVLALAVAYLAPAGLCGMVQDDAIGGAFDLARLRTVATDRDYAVGWLAGVTVLVAGGFAGQLLAILLVGFPILFAAQVLGFRYFARGYAQAAGVQIAPEGAEPPAGQEVATAADPDPLARDPTLDDPSGDSTTVDRTSAASATATDPLSGDGTDASRPDTADTMEAEWSGQTDTTKPTGPDADTDTHADDDAEFGPDTHADDDTETDTDRDTDTDTDTRRD